MVKAKGKPQKAEKEEDKYPSEHQQTPEFNDEYYQLAMRKNIKKIKHKLKTRKSTQSVQPQLQDHQQSSHELQAEPQQPLLQEEPLQNQAQQAEQEQPSMQQERAVDLQDMQSVRMQIKQLLNTLLNFKTFGRKSRAEYLDELKNLFCIYYGYNKQLVQHFSTFLNPFELQQFLQANETPRPLTIRTNSLKTRRKELAHALMARGVQLDPLAEWSKVGIKIYQSKVPIGATPQYLSGQYMIQSASSLLPVIALAPQPGEKVLDMAAAPGGKTTYICQLMKNSGIVYANDVKKERLRALQFNLQRMGCSNCIVTNYDGRKIISHFNHFDRVLLDAPCTGLGIISKDKSIKANKQMIDIYKHSHLQKQLLLTAIDCTKVGGTIVYSTCSVSPLQNEEVVNFVLSKRSVKVLDTGLQVGQPGLIKYQQKRFSQSVKLSRRIYPHVHNMDGFYFCKLSKTGESSGKAKKAELEV